MPAQLIPSSETTALQLTSKKLELWFADIEREKKPNQSSDSALSSLFLARFGLRNPQQIIEFLRSPGGKSVVAMMNQELIKIESLNQHQLQQNREAALIKQRQMIFILLSLIAAHEADGQHISELIQLQIDQQLKLNKTLETNKQKDTSDLTLEIIRGNIARYVEAIEALDNIIADLNDDLSESEQKLTMMEAEEINIANHYAHIERHLDEVNPYLSTPETHGEEVLTQLIHNVETQLAEQQKLRNTPQAEDLDPEIEGLKLKARGLMHAREFIRKEKILLNAQLEQVFDFEKAHFIIDPNQQQRLQKRGDTYAILPENVPLDKVDEASWSRAKHNFKKLSMAIHVVKVFHQNRMSMDLEDHKQRKEQQQHIKHELIEQIKQAKAGKSVLENVLAMAKIQEQELLTDHGSYALMMRLVPKQAPVPKKEEIHEVKRALQTFVSKERREELNQIISELRPEQMMSPHARLSWLNRAKKIIPDTPVGSLPNPDSKNT